MHIRFAAHFKQLLATLLFFLILAGCATVPESPDTSGNPETGPQAQIEDLASTLEVYQGESLKAGIGAGQSASISPGESIKMAPDGRAALKLPNFLNVELLGEVILRLDQLQLESGGSTFVKLDQVQGHTIVSLTPGAPIQLTLVTDYATATTEEPGTKFLVCHAPGVITCLTVEKGSVEFTNDQGTQHLKEGQASYVKAQQPPSPPICVPLEALTAWEEQARSSGISQALDQLVGGFQQEPCGDSIAQTPGLPGSLGMVNIPAGAYQVGVSQADANHAPVQTAELGSFWIDMYEVANAQYQQYLDQTGAQAPVIELGPPDHPVRGVTWDQAEAYCTWAQKRLPTEAEWEVAGRGQDSRLYPWGNEQDATGKILDLPRDQPYAVGHFQFNVSPFGIYDLVGNVWEWVGEPYAELQDSLRILRGGQFGLITDLAYRHPTAPDDQGLVPVAGFRCAADQVEE